MTTILTVAAQGPTGAQGLPGETGESAYEVAVANGFVGNEVQWLASLVGSNGVDGNTVRYGAGDPTSGDGNDGDFWINTTSHTLFGPKATTWPSGTSLIGPQGPQGLRGLQGESGAADEATLLGFTNWLNRLQMAIEGHGIYVPETDVITFRTTGSSFTPILDVTGTPDILWTWSDGTTSTLATPTKTFTGSAARYQTLTVTPWSALTGINLGYDAGDGGVNWIDLHTAEDVDLVAGLQNATNLVYWASSNTDITRLDFSGLTSLTTIESYYGSLVGVDLTGCTALTRACFESNNLLFVDFTDCPLLEDFRGTGNQLTEVRWGDSGQHLWHYCAMNNPLTVPYPMDQFPVLSEMWIMGSGVAGNELVTNTTALTSALLSGCQFVSATMDGCAPGPGTASIDLSDNELTAVSFEDAPGINSLDLSNNHLTEAMVDYVLATLDTNGLSGGTLNLSTGNAAPSSTGMTHYANLVGKGWTVHVVAPQVATPTFSPAAGQYEETQSVTISCTTAGATIHYTTNGSTPTEQSATYSTAISVSASETVRAIAILAGYTNSEVGSAAYTIGNPQAATPTFSPAAGTYSSTQSVTISCTTPSSTIYYTTNGDDPTTQSSVYASAVSVVETETLKAIATASGYATSEIGSAAYTITESNRIDFTTLGQVMDLILTASEATITWHWADATTSTGAMPTKDFGTSAERSGYVTIEPASALTTFGNNGNNSARLTTVSGLGNFPHLHQLLVYANADLTTIDVDGCAELNQLHLNGTALTSTSNDNLCIALAAQNIPYTGNSWGLSDWHTSTAGSVTSASAAARTTLSGLGWPAWGQ